MDEAFRMGIRILISVLVKWPVYTVLIKNLFLPDEYASAYYARSRDLQLEPHDRAIHLKQESETPKCSLSSELGGHQTLAINLSLICENTEFQRAAYA